jgi:hypothetical protein
MISGDVPHLVPQDIDHMISFPTEVGKVATRIDLQPPYTVRLTRISFLPTRRL